MESSAIRAYKILERHAFSSEEAQEIAEIMTASRDEHLEKWVASKEDLAKVETCMIKWFVGTSIVLTGVFSGVVFAMMKLMQ